MTMPLSGIVCIANCKRKHYGVLNKAPPPGTGATRRTAGRALRRGHADSDDPLEGAHADDGPAGRKSGQGHPPRLLPGAVIERHHRRARADHRKAAPGRGIGAAIGGHRARHAGPG